MEFLLVDDHPVYVDGLRTILEQMQPGCRVQSAASCAEGLSLLRTGRAIDLVLLDMDLPYRAELSALRAVLDACTTQRVAVLSGIEDPALARSALREGAAGYIPKSSSTDVIVRAISLILAGGIYVPPLLAGASLDTVTDSRGKLAKFGERTRERLFARGLTVRDIDVLELLVQGKPNKRIAETLGLSEGTVKVYVTRILRKLNVRNRTQAAFAVKQLG